MPVYAIGTHIYSIYYRYTYSTEVQYSQHSCSPLSSAISLSISTYPRVEWISDDDDDDDGGLGAAMCEYVSTPASLFPYLT